jgi:hypothetical protein
MSTTHRPPDPVHRARRATRTSHAGQDAAPTGRSAITWTFIVTSIAAFMVALDNLVVTMALPSIGSTCTSACPSWNGPSTPTR